MKPGRKKKENMKSPNKFTCHRDGTVTFYNGFAWARSSHIPSSVWRRFTPHERTRANTALYGTTSKEFRRERASEMAADRQAYDEMSQVERDAHDNM